MFYLPNILGAPVSLEEEKPMNAQPRTSIIMPVYNTGKSVVKAIQSVQSQTDQDWELLVVIDASPDNAVQVIARFLETSPDERVRVLEQPVNRGVSAARNRGLDEARGTWIAFLDSDDAFEPQFLESMHRASEKTRADVVLAAHKLVSLDGTERVRERVPAVTMRGEDAARQLLLDRLTPYLWDKIFAARVVEGVRFAEDIKRAEDALYVLDALANTRLLTAITEPLYRYTVDAGGLTWGRITPVEESDRLVERMAVAAASLKSEKPLTPALRVSSALTYLNNAQQALVVGGEGADATISACRSRISWNDVAACLKARPVFGAAGVLLKVSPTLYRALYGMYVRTRYGIGG